MSDPLSLISAAFDSRAERYDDSAMHRAVATATAEFADLTDVHVILDVATGTGLVLRAIAPRAVDADLIGVDISAGMLEVARGHLPGATWLRASAADIPVESASVDLLTCVTALHIIPDVPTAAAEWRRILRPGGRLVTATFQKTDTSGHGAPEQPSAQRPYARDHAPYSSAANLSATFDRYGFTLRRHREWSDDIDELLIAELVVPTP